jgi:hypothetical protein
MSETVFKMIRKQSLLYLAFIAYVGISFLGAFLFISAFGGTDSRQGALVYFYMSEIAALLFVIPLFPLGGMESEKYGALLGQFITTQANLAKIAGNMLRYPLLLTISVCFIPGLSAWFFGEGNGIPIAHLLRASLILLAIAIFMVSIGFYASVVCRNALSAAALTLFIVVLICTEPIWFGPVINSFPDAYLLIQSSLLINPFVNVAAALHFDIMRTNPFYHICPIGQLQFQYPSFWSAALFYLLMALVIFWRWLMRIRRMAEPAI